MCAMAEQARLDSVLSFSRGAPDNEEADAAAASDAGSDEYNDDTGFEFAFAPVLMPAGHESGGDTLALADDLFTHGRILPAYPLFDRPGHHLRGDGGDHDEVVEASTAPPSPDTYCAWVPRSAQEGRFPKSASAGEARRFWHLRDLVGGAGGRSHSDGKEKFVFLQPTSNASAAPSKMSSAHGAVKPSAPLQQQPKQGKKKSKAGAVTEMDMATAHRLFYSKQPGAATGGDRRPQHSYLPYRPGIVGFFATAHGLGRSHHPY